MRKRRNTAETAVQRQKQTQEQTVKEWASSVVLGQTKTVTSPHHREGELAGTTSVTPYDVSLQRSKMIIDKLLPLSARTW